MQFEILIGLVCSCLLVSSEPNGFNLDLTSRFDVEVTDSSLGNYEDFPCLEDNVAGFCVMYYNCNRKARDGRSISNGAPIYCNHYLEVCCPKYNIVEDNTKQKEKVTP